jgi:hypothetical protein
MVLGTRGKKLTRALAVLGALIPSLLALAPGASASPTSSIAFAAPNAAPSALPNSESGWAKTLGAGVVVVPPEHIAAGHGSTGTDCAANFKPRCSSNQAPAAIFSTGRTFKALWAQTVAAYSSTANAYSLDLCTKIGGRWYSYVPPST